MHQNYGRGTIKTLDEKAYFICSAPETSRGELNHIRNVFFVNNGYPYYVTNQGFNQVEDKKTIELYLPLIQSKKLYEALTLISLLPKCKR